MRYSKILLFFLLLFSFSFLQAQTKSYKRGLCFNVLLEEDVEVLSQGVSWAYNWGHTIKDAEIDNAFLKYGIDFIPMAWSGIDKNVARAYLQKHPEIKYILGFNEPNFGDQANLTPTQAAARWPDIEEIADEFGLIIVGPAVNYAGSNAVSENGKTYTDPVDYLDDFFAACPDCRVDHVALHLYMGGVGPVKSSVERLKKYNKPIWLTEFCANGTSQTEKSQIKFLVETLDFLETDPAVYRYAWFKERGNFSTLPNMQILDARNEGVLKELGEVFVHMSSYDDDFYFSVGKQIPSEHYISMKGVNMEKTTDTAGHLNLSEFGRTDWVDYNVDIPEAGEYNVFFRLAAEYDDDSEVFLSIDDQQIASLLFEKKGVGVWNTQQLKATFKQGKQRIRVGFNIGGLKLNWWAISKNSEAPSGIESAQQTPLTIHPNPVEDILYIQSEAPVNVVLSNLQGQTLYAANEVRHIDMTSCSKGLYLLTIQFPDGKTKTEKIIKK